MIWDSVTLTRVGKGKQIKTNKKHIYILYVLFTSFFILFQSWKSKLFPRPRVEFLLRYKQLSETRWNLSLIQVQPKIYLVKKKPCTFIPKPKSSQTKLVKTNKPQSPLSPMRRVYFACTELAPRPVGWMFHSLRSQSSERKDV